MNFEYFPGCTLKTTGARLDVYARLAAKELGFDLHELPQWQCCGGVYPYAKDEVAVRLSAVRALAQAAETGNPLVTLCSACHNVIKRTNVAMQEDAEFAFKVNNYLGAEAEYHGEAKVLHYLEVLRDYVGFDKIAQLVKKPLTGKKIGAYYGCLLLRPSRELCLDDPEAPTIMEKLIDAMGAEPVVYAMRNECCGGYTTMNDKQFAVQSAKKVLDNAKACGAEMIITACPLCMYNLNKAQSDIPVYYFTELLAVALGIEGA